MLGMKNYFNISGSIEIREVDIAGVACIWLCSSVKKCVPTTCPTQGPNRSRLVHFVLQSRSPQQQTVCNADLRSPQIGRGGVAEEMTDVPKIAQSPPPPPPPPQLINNDWPLILVSLEGIHFHWYSSK